jgi:hypothetical protein
MLLHVSGDIQIEDRWNHPAESVRVLRSLLAAGVEAGEDHQRKGFYEIEHDSRVFYIHLCPSGKVLLLAIWTQEIMQPSVSHATSFGLSASA